MKTYSLLLLWVSLFLTAAASPAADQATASKVVVGAIRWDAWHGNESEIGRAVQKSLSPKHWQWRLPFFAEVSPEGKVTIAGDNDAVMTREIAYAQAAGLDYWAFCAYGAASPMTRALDRYLANPNQNKIRFCLIGDASHWKPDAFPAEAKRLSSLMTRTNYQTVLNGRPLFYILNLAQEANDMAWAKAGGFSQAIKLLRQTAHTQGLADPYFVVMIPWPDKAKAFAEANDCQAISAYAVQAGDKNAPFLELTTYVEDFWKRSLATGAKIVPLAMTGWDRRPRIENPVFWEHNEGWGADKERFYQAPKQEELSQHISKALDWTRHHPSAAEAQAVIIYAWNEHDEGGWLCPTRGEGDARIKAMGKAIAKPATHRNDPSK